MTPRDERHLNRWTYAALIGVLLVAVLGHLMPEPVPDVQTSLDTVTAERGVDYQRVAQRNGRWFAECHADLVRAQDRLRRLGHRYSEEAHGWVRVR